MSTIDFSDCLANIERVGKEIARKHADDVDKNSRFPIEAVTALKEIGAFSWPIPVEYGGLSANPINLAKACFIIGQHCSATAAVLSMHFTQILSVVHHCGDNVQLQNYIRRCAAENRLIASVTSEVGPGGDMRSSSCAVEMQGDIYSITKKATTISYGSYADDLMITARKNATAASGDQVLVIAEKGQFTLSDVGQWDTLGLRGTCSAPATVQASGQAWQIMNASFSDIATLTMVPSSHIFWSACWLGLATDAVRKTRELFRAKGRSNLNQMPLGANRIVDLEAALQSMRCEVFSLAQEYTEILDNQDMNTLNSMAFALRINSLKLNGSRAVVSIVSEALAICGIQSYKNNGPFSLGRHLRDAFAPMMMVHNDRVQQTNASMLLIYKG